MSNVLDDIRNLDPNDPGRWPIAVRLSAAILLFLIIGAAGYYYFVWKQDHNGMTYVISPHPLPWLGEPTPPRPSRSLGDIFASGEFAGS